MSSKGELITETLDYNLSRKVTVYRPAAPVEAVVFAGDGELVAPWGEYAMDAGAPPTMVVGVHRLADEKLRLEEYSPNINPKRFAAHEAFFTKAVRPWVASRFGVNLPKSRTAMFGVSASGELALAMGLRHPDVYGAILCASPGAGYRPADALLTSSLRAYFVAGTSESFFRDNAERWAVALRDAGADVVMTEREGKHGGDFWRSEFPLMTAWAFAR